MYVYVSRNIENISRDSRNEFSAFPLIYIYIYIYIYMFVCVCVRACVCDRSTIGMSHSKKFSVSVALIPTNCCTIVTISAQTLAKSFDKF